MKPSRASFIRFLIIVLSLVTGLQVAVAQKKAPASPAPAAITGSGCVEAGVEAGCLVLTDTKTKVLYNLFFTGNKPAIGTAIHFTGTKHEGPTTCMQGQAVDVKKWTQIKMKCSASAPSK